MTANDHELLGQFTREHSQEAFTALVSRHLNLVYAAALRQVRSRQLAEEISLTVFTQLARHAASLAPDTVLTAWLYQVTRHAAIDVIRSEARRQAREQIACQMSALSEPVTDWTHVEPMLDEAMQSLDDLDRTAVLLRYFENKSLREVGEAIGASEDAAQKRVSRALERLREFISKRKVTVGAAGLAMMVSANAVQAAPAGLAGTVAAEAVLASAAISTSTAVGITKTIAMTTLQKTIVAAVLTGAVVAGLYQTHQVSTLRDQVQTFKRQQAQEGVWRKQLQEVERERDHATNALAALTAENIALRKNPSDVLKLRGEVGRLRQENVQISSTSPVSKITANPEARKMLRDQQKMGMSTIYRTFSQQLKLTSEQSDKLNDLLADHIMQNVDNVTTVLRDKPTPEQMNAIFAGQDATLEQQVEGLLGQDGLAKYEDYTKNLLSTITADQFKGMLTGTGDEKTEKTARFSQVLQEEAQAALAAAGLPADYQTVPMLNFRNIASEQSAEQSLKLLGDIYQRAAARAGTFLSPEDLAKFQEFKTAAINNNRAALTLNRTLMAPMSD